MNKFLHKYFLFFVLGFVLISSLGMYRIANAQASQNKLSLTVIPPFFQLPLNPGENWSSTIKVVNSNSFDLTVYAQVMSFQAEGEDGHGKFVPIVDSNQGTVPNTLAQWVTVTADPIIIKKESQAELPFSVRIPQNAPPGGNYAAILIGTKPPTEKVSSPTIQISTFISTLLFVRVAGDVVEQGDIRQFTADKSLFQSPDVNFILRFENTGNVHLQPQGNIAIYNMWGKERGNITVNPNTTFGYVLPKTVRKFQFNWKGDGNLFEIGRYKAVATLAYGQDSRKNVYSVTYFWIVPVKPTAGVVGGCLILIWLISWAIKAYVRKALKTESARLGISFSGSAVRKEGVDFSASRHLLPVTHREVVPDGFIKKHMVLVIAIIVMIIGIFGLISYFRQVLKSERNYQVILQRDDGTKQIVPKDGSANSSLPANPTGIEITK